MKPFFDSPLRCAALRASADAWLRTPWVPYSQLRGVGVSCHQLCLAIYVELGVLPPVSIPLRGFGAKHRAPAMDWLNSRPELIRTEDEFRAGDLLLLIEDRLHFAIVMPGADDGPPQQLVQCIGRHGVHYHSLHDASVLRFLTGVWRPLEQLQPEGQ